ncbi:hypothetical protein SDDV_ORF142 [Scale drop disease virus]
MKRLRQQIIRIAQICKYYSTIFGTLRNCNERLHSVNYKYVLVNVENSFFSKMGCRHSRTNYANNISYAIKCLFDIENASISNTCRLANVVK